MQLGTAQKKHFSCKLKTCHESFAETFSKSYRIATDVLFMIFKISFYENAFHAILVAFLLVCIAMLFVCDGKICSLQFVEFRQSNKNLSSCAAATSRNLSNAKKIYRIWKIMKNHEKFKFNIRAKMQGEFVICWHWLECVGERFFETLWLNLKI